MPSLEPTRISEDSALLPGGSSYLLLQPPPLPGSDEFTC